MLWIHHSLNFNLDIHIDLVKAFDLVDHKIMLSTQEYYGIRRTHSNGLRAT